MEGLTLFVAVSRAGEPCFTLEITRVPFTLGASPQCDVVLDDPFVSRKHAVVTLTRGQLHFTDTSSNGSFYRGQRVVNQVLQSGETVEIHPFEVRFEYALGDDEERHTALRGLDELISPEIRERLRAAAAQPRPQPPPRPDAAERGESAEPPAPPQAAHAPAAPPAPVGAEPRPVELAERPPGDERPPEMGHDTVTVRALDEAGVDAATTVAPVEEPEAPAVTVVPVVSERSRGPDATPDVEGTPAPPPPATGEETGEDSTAIVPPPIPIPPRRPPVSRADDRPPGPRVAPPAPPEQPDDEPPTIAFATIRPTEDTSDAAGAKGEGTMHMPAEQLVSLPPFSLEVVDGPPDQVGRTHPLPGREVTVGRGDQADFRLVCDNISRLHASLSPQGPGQWLLRDLASLNGTYVANQRITQVTVGLGGELRLANAVTLKLVETRGGEPPES